MLITSHFIFLTIKGYIYDTANNHIQNEKSKIINLTPEQLKKISPEQLNEVQEQLKEYRDINISNARLAANIAKSFQYSLIIIVVIVYPFYPFVYSKDNYFKRKGYENVVIEYQTIKKIANILLFPFIFSFFLYIVKNQHLYIISVPFIDDTYLWFILITIMVMGSGALLKMMFFFLRNDYRNFFAKGCFKIFIIMEDEVIKLEYLYLMLDSYNKYLKRSLKIEIKNIDEIYTNILYTWINRKNNSILLSITKSFEGNSLDLLRYLFTTFFLGSAIDRFLVKESTNGWFLGNLKRFGGYFAVIIPIVISIIEVIKKISQ
jgi:hypothetical protein